MYAIKCGNCKGTHATVDQVKACYGGENVKVTTVTKPAAERVGSSNVKGIPTNAPREPRNGYAADIKVEGITPKQETFLNKLLDERPMFRDVENLWPNNIAKLTKAQASKKIEEVLAVDAEVQKASGGGGNLNAVLDGIADGYFALPCKTGNNDLDFVRVGTNQGKFNPSDNGKRRVQRFLGGQGPIQISYAEAMLFAKAIAALSDTERSAAKELFGQALGYCGCCGKPLTDQESRAKGIGPVCDGKAY